MEESEFDSLAALLLAHPHSNSGALANNQMTSRPSQMSAGRSSSHAQMMAGVPAGANVVVYGKGPMQCLAARMAAINGFKTSLILSGEDTGDVEDLCHDETHPIGSIPLKFIPIVGENADEKIVNETVEAADGLIVAFDGQADIMSERALNILMPPESRVKHISLMSRSLNGEGMGFWANSAKATTNPDVWTADDNLVKGYKKMESMVKSRAEECGATFTIVRVGTLKGGGDGGSGEGGEPSFLNGKKFYAMGSQDIVNWRLIYDNKGLKFDLVKGDKLVGPGIRAVWDSRDAVGNGDSHRGAAAAALVEALRTPSAQNSDFSVKTVEGRKFPTSEQIASMYENA